MHQTKGILYIITTAIISGVSIYVNGLAVKFANPYVFTGIKNLLVGLAFLSLILLVKEWKSIKALKRKDWLRLILIGLIGGAIPFLLFFKGLTLTTAVKGSFIQKTMFIYVGFLAIIFLKEKLNKSLLVGLAALLVGNILFLQIKPQALRLGDLLIFIATLFWAVEIIIAKKALQNISANVVSWARMFFGAGFILIFLLLTHQAGQIFSYSMIQWQWILITSAFLLGYVFTFYRGLKYVRASVATAVLALGAPITGLVTLIAQGAIKWSAGQVWGVGLMIFGIALLIGLKEIFPFKRVGQIPRSDLA